MVTCAEEAKKPLRTLISKIATTSGRSCTRLGDYSKLILCPIEWKDLASGSGECTHRCLLLSGCDCANAPPLEAGEWGEHDDI